MTGLPDPRGVININVYAGANSHVEISAPTGHPYSKKKSLSPMIKSTVKPQGSLLVAANKEKSSG